MAEVIVSDIAEKRMLAFKKVLKLHQNGWVG
jgi:hypothetical protein